MRCLPDVASTPAADDSLHVLEEEVARLPEKYRLPVLLCYYEGLTHEEAAVRQPAESLLDYGHRRYPPAARQDQNTGGSPSIV